MVTVEISEIAGDAYRGESCVRFWTPYIVRPYDPTGAYVHDMSDRVAYRVAARQFIKLPHHCSRKG